MDIKLKAMEIEIYRATTNGLKKAKGKFFKENGHQFCLVKVGLSYYVIELSSGHDFCGKIHGPMTTAHAIKEARLLINSRSKEEIELAINMVKKQLIEIYKLNFPVNQPITNAKTH